MTGIHDDSQSLFAEVTHVTLAKACHPAYLHVEWRSVNLLNPKAEKLETLSD